MAISRRRLFLGAAAVSLTSCSRRDAAATAETPKAPLQIAPWSPPDIPPDPATAPALREHFAGQFVVGMAADPDRLSDPVAGPILTKHAGSLTPENVMKPDVLAPAENRYAFARAETLVAFAKAHGLAVQGTTLVWHMATPDWFFAGDPAGADYRSKVAGRLERYVHDVVSHFKGRIGAWVVVNEPTSNDAAAVYRSSRWHQILGTDYIDIALRSARAADPDAHLIINEYLTEDAAKRERFMKIIVGIKSRGVPLDGVGHQLHMGAAPKIWDGPLSFTAADVDDALSAVEARGLANHVTELDVSVYADPRGCFATGQGCRPALTGEALTQALQAQARTYHDLFAVFRRHRSLKSVTTWGVNDTRSWLNDYPAKRRNHPLMFDRRGQPKPAFWGAVAA